MNRVTRTSVLAVLAAAFVTTLALETAVAADPPKERVKERVAVMYFHRTQRCPTCKKMGSYSEEATKAVAKGQAKGKVSFYYVDFQDEKNAAYKKAYNISGPALIVAKVKGSNVTEYKNLKDIWTKVRDKEQFMKYVKENIESYLK